MSAANGDLKGLLVLAVICDGWLYRFRDHSRSSLDSARSFDSSRPTTRPRQRMTRPSVHDGRDRGHGAARRLWWVRAGSTSSFWGAGRSPG